MKFTDTSQHAASRFEDASNPGLDLVARLPAYVDAVAARRLLSDRQAESLPAIAAELADLVAARGKVRAGSVEWTVGPDGRLRCSLPTDDPYIKKG